jgi:CBS domain-containing protein
MAQSIRDVMTPNPVVCKASTPLADAARFMRDRDIGDVLVEQDGRLCGLVTDRDMVVRAMAESMKPETPLGQICTKELVTLPADASVSDAVDLMRDKALRRLPIVDDGKAVGIVSLGDLAMERDRGSALADISAAPPNG